MLRTDYDRRLIESVHPVEVEINAWERVLVFVATTHLTEHVSAKLRGVGVNAIALHGKLTQGARARARHVPLVQRARPGRD